MHRGTRQQLEAALSVGQSQLLKRMRELTANSSKDGLDCDFGPQAMTDLVSTKPDKASKWKYQGVAEKHDKQIATSRVLRRERDWQRWYIEREGGRELTVGIWPSMHCLAIMEWFSVQGYPRAATFKSKLAPSFKPYASLSQVPHSTGNTTNTASANNAIMGCPQNSQFSSMYGPLSYPSTPSNSLNQSNCFPPQYYMPPPCESFQFPYTHSLDQQPSQYAPSADPFYPLMVGQNAFEMQRSCVLQPNALQLEQERRALDAYKTKMARCKRKLARQRSLSNKNSTGASSTQITDARRLALHGASTDDQSSRSNTSKDLYRFLTPDNKRLRALLRKDLRNSDVGSLGRIVLPKREVEENLPVLNDKEGILLFLRDIFSSQEWALKFKYWSNNKSRMYVLENTGEFVKRNGLETGDSLSLYEDESKNLQYFSITKAGRPASVPSQTPQPTNQNYNYIYTPQICEARDEEKSSLALLIEQLNKNEQEEANSLMAVPTDAACSYTHNAQLNNDPFNNLSTYSQPASSAMQPSSSNGKMKEVDDSHIDDCYTGLGMLPDVYRYNFSL
ncbi:unnamed protein product [Dovyalis caffra]|uniref:TF-B3 domain-containing protein n=1 Tax=Dovyalis caffra TaxID=77055 RepID=A0AAV1SIS2_9ROSI|nr:unnamed protein product [Dovyalis caffra]